MNAKSSKIDFNTKLTEFFSLVWTKERINVSISQHFATMDKQTGSDFLAGRFMMPNIATESSGSCRVIRRVAMGGVALKGRRRLF